MSDPRATICRPLPIYSEFGSAAWADIDTADRHRRDDCAAYAACSARAWVERWSAWSCLACDAYSENESAHRVKLPVATLAAGSRAAHPAADVEREARLALVSPPELIVCAETSDTPHGPRHRVITPQLALLGARRAGLLEVPCVLVARAACPSCAAQAWAWALEPVLPDGYCPVCRRHIDATEDGWEYLEGIPSRAYLAWLRKRSAKPRLVEPPKPSTVVRAAKAVQTAARVVADAAGQLGLFLEEGL